MENLFLSIGGNETTTAQGKPDAGRQNLDVVIGSVTATVAAIVLTTTAGVVVYVWKK